MKTSRINSSFTFPRTIIVAAISLYLFTGLFGCNSKSTQPPVATVHKYIAKHETMVDPTLAELYIGDEKEAITRQINSNIDVLKSNGTLNKLQNTTFDFSNLKVEVVAETTDYVHDEEKDFIKVVTSGSYLMNSEGESKTIAGDKVLILEKEGGDWKVTETINPFG